MSESEIKSEREKKNDGNREESDDRMKERVRLRGDRMKERESDDSVKLRDREWWWNERKGE